MKSLISIALVLVMLFSFAACSGGSADQPKDTTVSNDTTASNPQNDIVYEEDDLPDDLRFGGEKITFLLPGQRTLNTEIFTDELNSDVVNDSVYNREKYVEDRLDVILPLLSPDLFSPTTLTTLTSLTTLILKSPGGLRPLTRKRR